LINKDRIIEIACILTDGNLETKIMGPNLVIHESDELLSTMDEWCTKHHGESGLTEKVRLSKIDVKAAEGQILKFIKEHIPTSKFGILSGNSVHVDRQFLCQEMPNLIDHLHYRIVDVSSFKEVVANWYPNNKIRFHKKEVHRALEDIEESIEELRFYKSKIFK
jgi:oligoribonuclease